MMVKKTVAMAFICLISTSLFAQAPAGYYSTATGTGYTLKTQLYNIIKDHTVIDYAGLYVTYQTSDIDNFFEKDGLSGWKRFLGDQQSRISCNCGST
jgi:hypothetical protein